MRHTTMRRRAPQPCAGAPVGHAPRATPGGALASRDDCAVWPSARGLLTHSSSRSRRRWNPRQACARSLTREHVAPRHGHHQNDGADAAKKEHCLQALVRMISTPVTARQHEFSSEGRKGTAPLKIRPCARSALDALLDVCAEPRMLPRALAAGGRELARSSPLPVSIPSPAMVVDGHDSSAEGAMMALSAYVTVGTTARPACVPREHHRLRAMARQRAALDSSHSVFGQRSLAPPGASRVPGTACAAASGAPTLLRLRPLPAYHRRLRPRRPRAQPILVVAERLLRDYHK